MEEKKKMNILDRIKKWWKQRNVKALPEAQPEYKEPENQFDERYKIEGDPPTLFEKGTLDYALDQYLSGVLYQGLIGQKYNSYRVLTDLGGISGGVPGNNSINETNLINYLNNKDDMRVDKQTDSKMGNVYFYHIRKNASKNQNLSQRLYLNCKRENIALLATNLVKNMDDMEHYYFKFNSDWQASNKTRSEQFVFYIEDDKQLNDVMQRIEKTKQQHPELFEGDKNVNPFLKNIDGYMAYANEPQRSENSKYATYVDLNGNSKRIKASYNTLLSTALEESFVEGINNMILDNHQLGSELLDEEINNPAVYAQKVLYKVLEDGPKKMQLIENMKTSLVTLSEKNPTLDIQGIDKAKEKQMKMQTVQTTYSKE